MEPYKATPRPLLTRVKDWQRGTASSRRVYTQAATTQTTGFRSLPPNSLTVGLARLLCQGYNRPPNIRNARYGRSIRALNHAIGHMTGGDATILRAAHA